jgi:hypothetical protein
MLALDIQSRAVMVLDRVFSHELFWFQIGYSVVNYAGIRYSFMNYSGIRYSAMNYSGII